MTGHARPVVALAFASALLLAGAAGAHAATVPALHPFASRIAAGFDRRDARLAAVAGFGVALASLADRPAWNAERGDGGEGGRRLASWVRPFGTATVLAPAVVLGWGAGRVSNRPALEHSSVRIGAAIVATAAATEALKLVSGRERPAQAPGDTDEFRLFSGHDSFPSGHTSVAFAAATALDAETSARWVPWAAYPLAGLVGWSRVHDNKHWTSDVVAGAALGWWTARKTERILGGGTFRRQALGAIVSARPGGSAIGVRLRF